MPDVEPFQFHALSENTPQGQIVAFDFTSSVLNGNRHVQVYLPADYKESEETYPALYVHDGSDYLNYAHMKTILDSLIAAGECDPILVVLIDPVEREIEYDINPSYAEFLATELVPCIDSEYRTKQERNCRGIMGASRGGLISFYTCLQYPETFGMVAGQSTAFWNERTDIIDQYMESSSLPEKIYMDIGRFEDRGRFVDFLQDHRRFRQWLEENNSEIMYREMNQGHAWGNWRTNIPAVLIYFF